MSKRSVFTTITPLPPSVNRQTVLDTLYTHVEMIDLNPLVEERHPIKPPAKATPEEYNCQWYELTDRISYLPGGLASGKVTYQACFHDLANGLQTHVYAPMGLDIKEKWTLGGTLPGEPAQPVEIGQGMPLQGLYLREDVDMRCNILVTSFVKKTLKKAHAALVARLVIKTHLYEVASANDRLSDNSYRSDEYFGYTSPPLSLARLNASRSPHLSLTHRDPINRNTPSPLGSPGFPSLMPTSSNTYGNSNGLVPEPLTLRSQSPLSMADRPSTHHSHSESRQLTHSTHSYASPGCQMDPSLAQATQLQHQQHALQYAMMQLGRNPYQPIEPRGQRELSDASPTMQEPKSKAKYERPPAYNVLPLPPKDPIYPVELPVETPSAPQHERLSAI